MSLCRRAKLELVFGDDPDEAMRLQTEFRMRQAKVAEPTLADSSSIPPAFASSEEKITLINFSPRKKFMGMGELTDNEFEAMLTDLFATDYRGGTGRDIWDLGLVTSPTPPAGIIQPTGKIGQWNFTQHIKNIP